MIWRAIALAVLALSGCVAADEPQPDACGASALQYLVGESADVLAAMNFVPGTRIIEYRSRITMDLRPDRLNIELNEARRIVRVWCG